MRFNKAYASDDDNWLFFFVLLDKRLVRKRSKPLLNNPPRSGVKVKGCTSCDLPALVMTYMPIETGVVISWLWYGGTFTIRWFFEKKIRKQNHMTDDYS